MRIRLLEPLGEGERGDVLLKGGSEADHLVIVPVDGTQTMIEKGASLGADLKEPIKIGSGDTPAFRQDLVNVVAVCGGPVPIKMRGKAPVASKSDVRKIVVDPAVIGDTDEPRKVEAEVTDCGVVAGIFEAGF